MLKFIPTDASKLGQKRKQCQKACQACRRKKKRCTHIQVLQTAIASTDTQEGFPECSRESRVDSAHEFLAGGLAPCKVRHEDDVRHLDMGAVQHPTTQLNSIPGDHALETSNNCGSPESLTQEVDTVLDSRFIGDLNPEGIFLAATSPTVTTGADQAERIGIWLKERLSKSHGNLRSFPDQTESSMFYGFDPIIQKVMLPVLTEECAALLPPQLELKILCSIYFDKYHPIFPIIDEYSFRTFGPTDPAGILLKQGLCLVASLSLSSKEYLRLSRESVTLSHREFGRRISAAMRTSIELGFVTKKTVLIQALALLSFFVDGPNGGDVSSQLCGRAVHYVHSIGIHIQSQQQEKDDQYAETLLCCIWALDRLNAALHGRPILMHERDLGKDLETCFRKQNVNFRLFLRVFMLLDNVICLYRPGSDKNGGSSAEFPLFEQLLEDIVGSQIPMALLATIETLYHAIAILSCRTKSPSEPQFSSISYLRRNHSATLITSIVSHDSRKNLSWFPFVPYAVSLSLSVAYRELRHSKLPMYRVRARSAMILNCNILQDIEEVSRSAGMMAQMGMGTLKEMDRVYHEVTNSLQPRSGQGCSSSSAEFEDELRTGSRTLIPDPVPDTGIVLPASDASWTSVTGGNNSCGPQGVDSSLTVELADLDIFALFDPNFDLDGIDAVLSGSLDMSCPSAFLED